MEPSAANLPAVHSSGDNTYEDKKLCITFKIMAKRHGVQLDILGELFLPSFQTLSSTKEAFWWCGFFPLSLNEEVARAKPTNVAPTLKQIFTWAPNLGNKISSGID